MARCPEIKANGQRCKGDAIPGAGWCYSHDPGRAAERRRNASKGGKLGGRGRGSGELAEIKREIRDVIANALSGETERGVAAVAFQGFNALLKAVETERKAKETDELEERLEVLEQAQERGRRWAQ
jgi:translation elongation factor EF-1beta